MPAAMKSSPIEIRPVAGALGAEMLGIDLRDSLTNAQVAVIREAFVEHLALLFPGTGPLSAQNLMALAGHFGELDAEPFVGPFKLPTVDDPHVFVFSKEATDRALNLGGFWHADVTYRARPHGAGLLYAKDCPSRGGDTMFANQYLAFESLSPGMQRMLEGLNAVHSSAMEYGDEAARFAAVTKDHVPDSGDRKFSNVTYARPDNLEIEENLHPVVRVHPDSGRKHLFVNRGFTTRFENMTKEESAPLLEFLWQHACRPEFTCRFRWHKNAVVLWDNRCTHHCALNDYYGDAA